jgi:predicted nucleic acid-binding protein
MPPAADQTNMGESELRVVIDAQIVLAMFLTRRDNPEAVSPKRWLLELLTVPTFHWLWTLDIINDYECGAEAIESDEKIVRRAEFDRVAFKLFLAALRLSPPVTISVTTLRNARRRIAEAPRAAERDLEDAIYLACAVDGNAHLLTTEDSDLRLLGSTYEGVRIVSWGDFRDELANRELDVGWG